MYRKPVREGFVETPRPRRPRKSVAPSDSKHDSDASPESQGRKPAQQSRAIKEPNGSVALNGRANGKVHAAKEMKDPRVDDSGHLEFGGSWGVSAMMIGFPLCAASHTH